MLLACVALTFSTNAQTEKGTTLLAITSAIGTGGNTNGFSITSVRTRSDLGESEPERTTSFNLSPRAGYFLADNFVAGIEAYWSSAKQEDVIIEGDILVGDIKASTYGAGPFLRYYFKTNTVQPFLEASLNIGVTRVDSDSFIEYTDNLFRYGFAAGAAIPLGKRVSLDVLLGYTTEESKPDEDNPENFRVITSNFGMSAGFSIYLDRKSKA